MTAQLAVDRRLLTVCLMICGRLRGFRRAPRSELQPRQRIRLALRFGRHVRSDGRLVRADLIDNKTTQCTITLELRLRVELVSRRLVWERLARPRIVVNVARLL